MGTLPKEKTKPEYTHDCTALEGCVFVGHLLRYDLYYHIRVNSGIERIEFIGRYGNEGSEYLSLFHEKGSNAQDTQDMFYKKYTETELRRMCIESLVPYLEREI